MPMSANLRGQARTIGEFGRTQTTLLVSFWCTLAQGRSVIMETYRPLTISVIHQLRTTRQNFKNMSTCQERVLSRSITEKLINQMGLDSKRLLITDHENSGTVIDWPITKLQSKDVNVNFFVAKSYNFYYVKCRQIIIASVEFFFLFFSRKTSHRSFNLFGRIFKIKVPADLNILNIENNTCVYVVNVHEQNNITLILTFFFVKKQKYFSLRDDFFGYNFPNFIAPMTLLFDQLSYFKQ